MKKSTFQNIIKEELVKVLKDKSYLKEFKKLTIKEAGDYKDVSDKFKDALDDLPDAKFSKKNIEALIKKFREKRPDAAMAYAKDAFGWIGGGKWLKEADVVQEADFKYFRQYLIKLGKELGDKRLVQAAEKASDSKIKAMFKKDKHYKIFKDAEVQKLSGKQLHGKIKYDDRFNESKLNEVNTEYTGKGGLKKMETYITRKIGWEFGISNSSFLKKLMSMVIKQSRKEVEKKMPDWWNATGEYAKDPTFVGAKERWLTEDKVKEVLSKIKGNSPADKGKRAAVEDDIARAKKKGNKKEVEKLKEARGKKVTQSMWKKMDIYQRIDALLTIIEDPDRAEKFIEKKWNQLPNDRNFMTTESALKALKEKLVFYQDDEGRKRRFDTDKSKNNKYR